ncbi:MAG: cupin domain-containing protein [Sphingobium sp.]
MEQRQSPRRVVTGLDADGRSCVIIDGPVPVSDGRAQVIWHTPAVPADNGGIADTSAPFGMAMLKDGGSSFSIVDMPPGMPRFMHATDTIDYMVVLRGTITLELEAGEVTLGPGDAIVGRGTAHAWRNDGPETVTMASVILPAHPVGPGATI